MVLAYADVKDAAEFLSGSAEPSEDSNLLEKRRRRGKKKTCQAVYGEYVEWQGTRSEAYVVGPGD